MKNRYHLLVLLVTLGTLIESGCRSKKDSVGKESILGDLQESNTDSINKSESIHNKQLWIFEPLPKEVQTNFFNKKLSDNVLVDRGYWTWGLSVIRWNDGKYHAYYSRWKYEYGFKSWLTDCEIVHGVSDKPEGPYKFVNVVLESRNNAGWESATAHNPSVAVADGKLYLYYISTDLAGIYNQSEEDYPISKWMHDNWNIARNNQRIGLAVAIDPSGPFKRTTTPIVEPDGVIFKNIAVNPAVTFANDKFTMIMKGDDVKHEEVFRIQLVGHSDQAEGPFEFKKEPVYDKVQTEDATIWYDKLNDQYFMVCHVLGKPELMLMSSQDSYQWKPASNSLFTRKEIRMDNGEVWKPERMERPFVLTDRLGQPVMLFVAIKDKGVSGNIAIPIKIN